VLQPRHRIGVAFKDQVIDLSEIKHYFTGPVLASRLDIFDQVRIHSPFLQTAKSGLLDSQGEKARSIVSKSIVKT